MNQDIFEELAKRHNTTAKSISTQINSLPTDCTGYTTEQRALVVEFNSLRTVGDLKNRIAVLQKSLSTHQHPQAAANLRALMDILVEAEEIQKSVPARL